MSVEGANHAVIPHWLKYALLSLAVFASALVAFLLVAVGWRHKTESKKHVDRVDWLPASASDITYRRRGGFGWFVQYECTLPESNFHVLATNKGWPVQQATNLVIPTGVLMQAQSILRTSITLSAIGVSAASPKLSSSKSVFQITEAPTSFIIEIARACMSWRVIDDLTCDLRDLLPARNGQRWNAAHPDRFRPRLKVWRLGDKKALS